MGAKPLDSAAECSGLTVGGGGGVQVAPTGTGLRKSWGTSEARPSNCGDPLKPHLPSVNYFYGPRRCLDPRDDRVLRGAIVKADINLKTDVSRPMYVSDQV